jgi:hypothetical protein
MYLYHYFEKENGPFLNLSDLNDDEAIQVQIDLAAQHQVYAKRYSKRYANGQYIFDRRIVEKRAYSMFIRKGGKPQRQVPYYGILSENELEECYEWFDDGGVIKIPIDEFDKSTVSFTYGDSFPEFKPWKEEEPEYNLYLYNEIIDILKKQGIPPIRTEDMSFWNGPPTYIEAQVWSDETINKYR